MSADDTLAFTPCSQHCPAITGKAYGSVQFCPMQEPTRHREGSRYAQEWRRVKGTTKWEGRNDTEAEWVEGDPNEPQPLHRDYTDCCANWQCCLDEADEQGHGGGASVSRSGPEGPAMTRAQTRIGAFMPDKHEFPYTPSRFSNETVHQATAAGLDECNPDAPLTSRTSDPRGVTCDECHKIEAARNEG